MILRAQTRPQNFRQKELTLYGVDELTQLLMERKVEYHLQTRRPNERDHPVLSQLKTSGASRHI
ncbi:hypothetical protein INR49_000112 [Caranx melampygus]|nr:hypothetical protein INR49_000112 [Caranx melampygus]